MTALSLGLCSSLAFSSLIICAIKQRQKPPILVNTMTTDTSSYFMKTDMAMMEKSKGVVGGGTLVTQKDFSVSNTGIEKSNAATIAKVEKEAPANTDVPKKNDFLRDTFDLLDKDKGGSISFAELKAAMSACDRKIDDKELRDMLHSRGFDPENLELDYDAFCNFMGGESSYKISLSDVHKFFHALDLDGSGYLTAAELRHVMTNMNLPSNDGVMDEMIAMYDLDGNGQVQVDEFVELVKGLGMEVYDDTDGELEKQTDSTAVTKVDAIEEGAKAEEDEVPSISVPIESFPKELQSALAYLDFTGDGTIAEADLLRAAELLKIEKMAGVHDPEANPSLHWTKGREKRGLGEVIYKANHIALIVEDVGRSAAFYSDVLGFQQIRRPNFDRHGAWFTMGNLELHLIKGTPLVHSGDDLIVGHISIETFGIDKVPGLLRKMNVPFRQNVSVPKGSDAGGTGTNSSNSSKKIVRQYFFRDPDGYYIEVCNCGTFAF